MLFYLSRTVSLQEQKKKKKKKKEAFFFLYSKIVIQKLQLDNLTPSLLLNLSPNSSPLMQRGLGLGQAVVILS